MKKTNYLEPRIELSEVIVEAGIAVSDFGWGESGVPGGDLGGDIYDDEL